MPGLEGIGIDTAIAAEAERVAAQEEVGQADFLKLLVAQLENQDPLNPQDSAAFAAQLAQFSSVEQLVAIRSGIDELAVLLSGESSESEQAANIDPTNLVGREVVVFGSQIEVDDLQTPIRLPLRMIEDAVEATVRIYDTEGVLRHEASILPLDANGRPISLRPGDHDYLFDPSDRNLPPGVYAIEFTATGAAGQDVTILPMVEGLVTGAILTGEPSIRLGSRIFSVEDILEVRLSTQAGVGTGGTNMSGLPTGGGQTVVQPIAPLPPRPAS